MPTVQVSDLNTLAVYVSDLEAASSFYVEQLGFQPCDQMPPGMLLKAGEVTLYLEGGRKPRSSSPLSESEVSFCLGTAGGSVKEAHEKLKSAGVAVVEDYQEFAPTFAAFRIADPDGNVIEFAGKP
jgi:catechol 2,3-dioxygenase-like lactoylglutathione lyase family enzyme